MKLFSSVNDVANINYLVKEALLFAADSAENIKSLKPGYAYQSQEINVQTLEKLTFFPFDVAVFGHGNAAGKKIFDSKFK